MILSEPSVHDRRSDRSVPGAYACALTFHSFPGVFEGPAALSMDALMTQLLNWHDVDQVCVAIADLYRPN